MSKICICKILSIQKTLKKTLDKYGNAKNGKCETIILICALHRPKLVFYKSKLVFRVERNKKLFYQNLKDVRITFPISNIRAKFVDRF